MFTQLRKRNILTSLGCIAIRCLPVASDHTIGMTTEAFSISMLCGPVGSEIKVYGQWVSTRLMAYKRASLAFSLNQIPWRWNPLPGATGHKGGVIVHSKLIRSRSVTYFVCIGTTEVAIFCLHSIVRAVYPTWSTPLIFIGLYCNQRVSSYKIIPTTWLASIAVKYVKLIIAT